MTFDNDHLTVDSARGIDDELFTTPSTDPTPDRHPSILRPGGHSSPLKHPSALRPGAARQSRTPSPHSAPTSPPPAHHPPRASPSPAAYKAYSPPKPPQSPSEELSSEIEGYFTALEVPPLRINRTPEPPVSATPPLPPKELHSESLSLESRCASPPVPPKETFQPEEERHVVSPFSELEAPTGRTSQDHVVSPVSESEVHVDNEEAPPPYEESQFVPPPPEKTASSHRSNSGSPVGAAAASAAHVGGATVGVPVNEAIASSTAALAAVTIEEPQAIASQGQSEENDHDDIYSAGPPPLPPRPTPSPTGKKGKDPAMPGAFPPPPPSQPSQGYKASGAAATSAAGVSGSIAGVGQSASLKQARKALEKGLGHLIDKAKEHHHAREQQSHEKKSSGRKKSPEGARKSVENSGNVAQVSGAHSGFGLGVDADLCY